MDITTKRLATRIRAMDKLVQAVADFDAAFIHYTEAMKESPEYGGHWYTLCRHMNMLRKAAREANDE